MLVVVSAGCSQLPARQPDSVFYNIPAGSVLQLNQDVEILPNQVSLFVQHGQRMAEILLDRYQPYCKFEIYTRSDKPRVIRADRFVIERVVDEMESTTRRGDVMLAALKMVSDSPVVFTYTTHMYLHSESQPDVYRMSCMHWESVMDDDYLTVPQMREAMGKMFTLQLASTED